MPMNQVDKPQLSDLLINLKESIHEEVPLLDDKGFNNIINLWHEAFDSLKDAVFDNRHQNARVEFEEGWGAQSIQFVIDCIPELHRIMRTHYQRGDHLSFLDVGSGTGAGANIFSMLHSGRHVYSKLSVDAVDYVDSRLRWVKTMYPRVNYKVADVYDLPDKNWDIVFCSHVIEHVDHPEIFLEKLIDICKGFLIVYSPYNETDKIPAHKNTITESLYDGLKVKVEKLNLIKSMGWHADIPDDLCILAVIDCRRQTKMTEELKPAADAPPYLNLWQRCMAVLGVKR